MPTSPRKAPLYLTFGNHMHWVDMQWLWGYGVLPGSTADMLALIDQTHIRGGVNFDGVGYEKMAAESPEALASLRAAVADGRVEPVGCSYGQPYGLFHGGESNVRQLVHGRRAVRRLLGVEPRAFWEEEFYFFPQLPQMLVQTGFTSACLFFQWTWHTPEMPKETASLIQWEGIDGTRIPALPRNGLNVHQWPEDFDGLLESPMLKETGATPPAIVQWLELMPTKDWMCRSEVLLPRMKELMADPRFDVRPGTVSTLVRELSAAATGEIPVRRYTMDDVWHGMTAGKNGDAHPRYCADVEREILSAESLATLAGFLGRPYPSWDVYPSWELDEAWRELLAAQHHDNHECEGLCGFVGYHSLDRALSLAREVRDRTVDALCSEKRLAGEGEPDAMVVFNPLPWAATVDIGQGQLVAGVPPMGFAVVSEGDERLTEAPFVDVVKERHITKLVREGLWVSVDARTGRILQMGGPEFDFVLDPAHPLLDFTMTRGGKPVAFDKVKVEVLEPSGGEDPSILIERESPAGDVVSVQVRLTPGEGAVELEVDLVVLSEAGPPDGGLNAGLQMGITPSFGVARVLADTPYAIDQVKAEGVWKRKYPKGDWMTSPQWFEEVRRPFTSRGVVDLIDAKTSRKGDRGLLIVHDTVLQWFRGEGEDRGVRCLLSAYDPWDEARHRVDGAHIRMRLYPHGPLTNAERMRRGMRMAPPQELVEIAARDGAPHAMGLIDVSGAEGVVAHAVFRENPKAGEHLPGWAGHTMREASGGACEHPLVVRLVEWNGEPATVTVKLPGKVAKAARTDLHGNATAWLEVAHPAAAPAWAPKGSEWSAVTLAMRPREIATVMADCVQARKQWRDLDAKREVWATVHKTEG